jgi:hypothetical protein
MNPLRLLSFTALLAASAHAVPLVNPTDSFRYRKGSSAPQANWRSLPESSLDASWLTGPGFIGYGDGSPGSVLSDMRQTTTPANPGYLAFFARRSFTIPEGLPATERLFLRSDYDDGFVAWIVNSSGTSVAGDYANVSGITSVPPAAPSPDPAFNARANGNHECSFGNSSPQPARVTDLGPVSAFPPGTYTLCLMGLNDNLTSSDAILHSTLYTESPPPPATIVWSKAASPYSFAANFTVPANSILTIEPGVTVRFASGTGLIVNGQLLAEGTAAEPITFTRSAASGTWDRIRLDNAGSTRQTHRIVHTRIEYASSSNATVRASDTNIHLENVRFTNVAAQMVDMTGSSCVLLNCEFNSIPSGELIHFSSMPSQGYALVKGCRFGTPGQRASGGYNDIIDFTGGNRPGPIVRFIDNVFLSGVDDVFDMDGTDAHIEGNAFFSIRKDSARASSSNCITTGANGSDTSQLVICRNWFYNIEHAFLQKDRGSAVMQNNTIVNITPNPVSTNNGEAPGLVMFGEPWRGDPYGSGLIFEGNIGAALQITDPFPLLSGAQAAGAFFSTRANCIQGFSIPGTGNLNADPLLVSVTGVDFSNYRTRLALQPTSPCRSSGPNGLDMGADVPSGASISGEPPTLTNLRDASLRVAGPGIWAYRWRLNAGPWSPEISLVPASIWNGATFTSSMFDNAPPISLSDLPDGTHSVEVLGRNSAGDWQESPTVSRSWTVSSIPPDSDADGMPDAWELTHNLDPASADDAPLDPDGDGLSNLSEFIAGTSPRDAASTLALTASSLPDSSIRLSFNAVAGKSYRIDSAPSPNGPWSELTRLSPADSGPVSHDSAISPPNRFFRLTTPASN